MSLLPLHSILETSLSDLEIACDNARSHSRRISVVQCQRRPMAYERRDERRWLSIPGNVPKARPTNISNEAEEKAGRISPSFETKDSTSSPRPRLSRPSLASPLVKPVRQLSIKHLQTEKLPSLPKSGQRRTLEKSGSNRRLRLSRQGSREFVCKNGTDDVSHLKKISLKVSCQDLNTILAGGTGGSGPLRIPVRQRSIRGINCNPAEIELDVVKGKDENQQLESKVRKPHLLGVSDSTNLRDHSKSPIFKRKSFNSPRCLALENVSREASIVPKQ
ncbi:hypothetical protein FisN_8Hh315 [Fistulifera solaris]|uniref:Uncharacterized protein n=1 Tax=Fistulifera solaris TaxID=1519565 RepID=A0A1Z5KI70_FISSO|nr:hypothetical protein FisN_8Hh315 [Fistulifera solaris]|eukprot:GAX25782.1 hypothetical protein FisN_8Hh315 [Fistulifera solaris]